MFLKPLLYLKKDIVIGLGEIGTPIYKLFSKSFTIEVYDINPKLIDKNLKKNVIKSINIKVNKLDFFFKR